MEIVSEYVFKFVLALLLGGLVGLERERSHKPAGLRTHMLVTVGAALMTIFALLNFPSEAARIIAGIVTGIGFLGAGTIIAQGDKGIHGLTTAATLWVSAGVGIAIGAGRYTLGFVATVITIIILFLGKFEHLNK